jgi:hypothetical protein
MLGAHNTKGVFHVRWEAFTGDAHETSPGCEVNSMRGKKER